MMENKTSQLDCLGIGVDCRTLDDNWLSSILNTYGGERVIDQDKITSTTETPVTARCEEVVEWTNECTKGGECGVNIKLHECAKLFGELTISRYASTVTKHRKMLKITKVAQITSQRKDGRIHCTKYVQDLCQFILKHIEEGQEEQVDLGKKTNDLDPVDRFEEYLSVAKKSKDESSLKQTWQMVADACCSFLDEKKYTHYVRRMKLGARQQELTESKKCGTSIAGGAGGSAGEGASCSIKVQYQAGREGKTTTMEEVGVIDSNSGAVTTEEIIEVTLSPLFELFGKNELSKIMQALLHCYDKNYARLGPFQISFREDLQENEQEIYWQVIDNKKICGTTKPEKASTFYIKYASSEHFQIIYETESMKTKLHVLPEAQQPLKLVKSTNDQRNISFQLKDTMNKEISCLPQTMVSWKTESPYFILNKRTEYYCLRSDCYICVEKQEHDDEQLKYEVVASKKQEMDNGLMLVYFTPVTKPQDLPAPVQLHIQSDFSEVGDELSQQLRDSAPASAPPPPPIEQPDSGFAPGNDLPSELKDFLQLVGDDYIFPLQVNTEGT